MRRILLEWSMAGTLLLLPAMSVLAQDSESEEPGIVPVELYICKYNEGKSPADLDKWAVKWNAWADSAGITSYSAYTLVPFYFGAEQDFDFIWLGVSPTATEMGRAYDNYLANSGSLNSEFEAIAHCSAHNNFATLQVKKPPNDGANGFVLSFSDCKQAEGKTFEDVQPALQAWSEYRTAHGSQSGMWVMWPAYGGGGEATFDFKFAVSHANYESLGMDYDQYGKEGYKKGDELFKGVLDCDSSRAYNAVMRREGMPEDGQ